MITKLKNFANDESGATAIEYGLIAALVSVAAIAALRGMGESLSNLFIAALRGMGESLSNLFGTVSAELSAAVISAG